jgi:hypothetical protein
MAWRRGVSGLLQTSLARAVFTSALATGTAFGALCLSPTPARPAGLILMIAGVDAGLRADFRARAAGPGDPGEGETNEPRKLLLAAIHDVGPRAEARWTNWQICWANCWAGRNLPCWWCPIIGARRRWPQSRLSGQIRGWADQGVEMFVHGWFHKDLAQHMAWPPSRPST